MTTATALFVSGAVLTVVWLGWAAVRAPYSDERQPSPQERQRARVRAEMDAFIAAADRERQATAGKQVARIVTNEDGLLREMVPPTTEGGFMDVLIVELANTGGRILQREREGRTA